MHFNLFSYTHSFHSLSVKFMPSMLRTHLFLSTPMYTCRAKRANTIRQNTVSVITSTSCLMLLSRALMMVFRPAKEGRDGSHVSEKLTDADTCLNMHMCIDNYQLLSYTWWRSSTNGIQRDLNAMAHFYTWLQ